MKKYILFLLYIYGMTLILPLLLSLLLSPGTPGRYLSAEDRCLTLLLSAQIPDDYPPEALRAQAVLARTNLEAAGDAREELAGLLESCDSPEMICSLIGRWERCRDALETTDGVLTYEGEVRRVPYHRVSSGQTRDGAEVFHDEAYAYLASVESPWDCNAPNYGETRILSDDYGKNLEIARRDGAGYVMEARAGAELVSGEELRRQLELPSAAFSLRRSDGKLRVLCRGVGHGLGLSQWGARAMALEGSSCSEILNYYFPAMEIN